MRWDNLKIDAEEERALPGYRDPAVVRRFDAPEALDTRFYEIRAKSALNKVPDASRMPFRWTINPYRGCTHACSYCVEGDTPILMADGTAKALRDVVIGDLVCGTRREGSYRRYTESEVRDHWQTVKPAYRLTLEDGTTIVSSGDHRFLACDGWKHVAAARPEGQRRPHLTVDDKLVAIAADGPRELSVSGVEDLGVEMPLYDITTSTGDFIADGVVSHNCFARPTHKYLDFDAGRDFEREIVVKINVPEVLRAELRRPSWKGEHVAMGTNTDPYQWVESKYELMPGIWEALRDAGNPCSVLTKSPLLLRDIELLKEVNAVTEFGASFSIPTLDEKAWRASEPRTPHPRRRIEALAELTEAGIPCGVLIAPVMPGINDAPGQVEEILDAVTEAGAASVGGIALHLRGEVRQVFMDWMKGYRPDLVPRYEQLYRRGAYAPPEVRRAIEERTRMKGSPPRRFLRPVEEPEPEQVLPPVHAGQEALF